MLIYLVTQGKITKASGLHADMAQHLGCGEGALREHFKVLRRKYKEPNGEDAPNSPQEPVKSARKKRGAKAAMDNDDNDDESEAPKKKSRGTRKPTSTARSTKGRKKAVKVSLRNRRISDWKGNIYHRMNPSRRTMTMMSTPSRVSVLMSLDLLC